MTAASDRPARVPRGPRATSAPAGSRRGSAPSGRSWLPGLETPLPSGGKGRPAAVRVVLALARLAAATSARWRSAVSAEPLISSIENILMTTYLPSLMAVSRRLNSAHQLHADAELHLRFGEQQALALQADVVAVGTLDQARNLSHHRRGCRRTLRRWRAAARAEIRCRACDSRACRCWPCCSTINWWRSEARSR